MNSIKLFLSFTILTVFISCKGQIKSDNKTSQNSTTSILKLDKKIWSIYQDKNNNYWFGSNGNGVFHYDGKILKNYTTQDGLVHNQIRGIQGDHLGNVYIQTPEGISKYDLSTEQADKKTFTTLQPNIISINEWKLEANDLWFNCNGNANHIYRYDGTSLFELTLPKQDLKEAFGVEEKERFSPYTVYGIDKDKAGNLWIGTVLAGAFRYDGKSFLWFPEKELSILPDGRVPGVRSMVEDKNGYFWLSNFISKYKITDKGTTSIYKKMQGADLSKEHFENVLPYFLSGQLDDNGNLWMATYSEGIWKYDGESFIRFLAKDGDREALLISVYKDNQGVLWLGTDNLGVFKFNGKDFVKFEPGV